MDASVNMKMTPEEFRLFRMSVESQADALREAVRTGDCTAVSHLGIRNASEARATEAKLRSVLAKI